MKIPQNAIPTFLAGAVALCLSGTAYSQKNLDHAPAAVVAPSEASHQVRLKLADGSYIAADEASESEQGIWYRQGGMSHLIPRAQVKGIERGVASKPKPDLQVAKVVVSEDTDNGP